MKYLRIKMPDSSKWDVPCDVIAKNRTEYYSEKDGYKENSKEWKDEFDFSMSENEIMDWAPNNMDWDNVKEYAKKVEESEPVDYQEGWGNGEKEIVEY